MKNCKGNIYPKSIEREVDFSILQALGGSSEMRNSFRAVGLEALAGYQQPVAVTCPHFPHTGSYDVLVLVGF
jgi:hypothetical protein